MSTHEHPEQSAVDQSGPDRHPRAGTIVWGVILALLGLGCLGIGLGLRLDLQLALIVLLAVGGVGLLVKAVLPGSRTRV